MNKTTRLSKPFHTLFGIVFLLIYSHVSWGQIAALELGTTSLSANTTGAATFTSKDANIASLPATTLTVGQQTQPGGAGYIASKNWGTTTSINTAMYYQFTLTASSGYAINVTQVSLRMYRSSTGPASIALSSDADSYATQIGGVQTLASASNSTISFSSLTLTGKSSITFRIYGYNASAGTGTLRIGDGTASSTDISIVGTVASIGNTTPTLSSPTATSITATTAVLGATVTNNGGVPLNDRGTLWGTASSPTGNSASEGGTSVAAFSHSRSVLTPNTLYTYRGYAANSIGTSYSSDGTFTTLPNAPSIGSGSAATQSSFTANWTAPSGGSASFTYNIQASSDITFATTNAYINAIASNNVSQNISTGLSAGTTYYYRVRAENTTGFSTWSTTSAGITTSAATAPIITSPTANTIANTTATLGGNITNLGGTSLTGNGIVWSVSSTNANPTIGALGCTQVTGNATATGAFTINISSLPAGTALSYSAYATNSVGTTYTNSGTFTTLVAASKLAFGIAPPSTGAVGSNLTSFTIQALRPDNTVDTSYTGNVTIVKTSGSGSLLGTLTTAASAGIATFSGVQFDSAGTYTINATSGSLTASVASGNIVISISTVPSNSYRTTSAGTWALATWDRFVSGSWTSSTAPLPNTTNTVYIRHAITSGGSITPSNIIIANGGTLTYTSASTNATSMVVQNGGVLQLNAALTVNGTFTVELGGTVNLNDSAATGTSALWGGTEDFQDGSIFNVQDWNYNSTVRLIQNPSLITANSTGYYFGNLTISGAPSKLFVAVASNQTINLCKNDFTVSETGTNNVSITNGTANATIGGNLVITTGQLSVAATTSGNPITTVLGNISVQSGGILNLNQGISASATSTIQIKGNLSVPLGATLSSTDAGCKVVFSGTTATQTTSIAGTLGANVGFEVGDATNATTVQLIGQDFSLTNADNTFAVKVKGILDFNYKNITGLGTFTLDAGGTLRITDAAGVNASDTNTGNILCTRVAGSYSQTGFYHFIGNVTPQSTGNAMTSGSTAKRIIIDKTNPSDIVNLTQSTSTTDRLEIIQGTFVETALANIAGSGALTMSGGTYKTAVISPVVVPQLSGTYTLSGGTIDLNAAGAQILNGVPSYNNITFSNSGTKTLSSSISTVTGTVTIQDAAFVDTGSSTFGGAGTNLTMTGTSRLIVSGARTLPDMTGTYSLTGGTIEFAGSSAYHAVKSPINYNNILISGTNANGGSGNYTLNNGGSFTVNSGATFNATDQRIIAGGATASITINGTFNTANVNGFSGNSTTSISPTNTSITLGSNATIQYSRTSAQAVSTRTDYANLSIVNSGIKSLSGAIGLSGNLNIGSGSTLNANSFVITPSILSVVTIDGTLQTANLNGFSGASTTTLSNTNNFTTALTNSTIEYNASASQTLSSRNDYNNIIANNSGGLVLNGACTLNGILSLTSGTVNLGSNNLTIGTSGNIAITTPDATKMIIATGAGQLKKMVTGNSTFTFPIGDTTGTADYSPITISTLGSSYTGASISVSVADANHPNNNSATNFLTRYWTVNQSGISDCILTLNGTYTALDISGNVNAIKAAQLVGTFNQATNPWIKIGGNILTGTTLTFNGAVLASGQPSVFTGISSSDPIITTINDSTVCRNAATTLTATITGEGPYLYSWTGLITGATTTASVTASTTTSGGPNLYTISVKDANGIIATTSTNLTVDSKNTWTGATSSAWTNLENWSCGYVPDATTDVTISSGTNTPLITANFSVNSLTIDSGLIFTIPSGISAIVNNFVHNNGTMTIANNANLIQTSEVSPSNMNTGTVTVNRNSAPLLRLDHTLWASPVTGIQTLKDFSPGTLQNRFYTYATFSNSFVNVPIPSNAVNPNDSSYTANNTFTAGKGYAIRASNSHSSKIPSPFGGVFSGIPNNGTKPIILDQSGLGYNLVGNPYPSAIAADLVISNNSAEIGGTIYFYAHSLTMNSGGSFNGSNYSTWNGTGHALAGHEVNDPHPLPLTPNGIIQVGQGFIVKAKTTGSGAFNFTNAMRVATASEQFFRTNPIEKHRLWLNLKMADGSVINQILVGYIEGATQEVDSNFDGLAFASTSSALSSKIGASNYAIQGRSLPFNSSDEVPLGFKATTVGNYTISLAETDGLFAGSQNIFVRDNLMGIDHNIIDSPYTFASDAGTFDARFELVYTQALGIPSTNFTPNSVIVYKNTDWFHVNTKGITMKEIQVYDISGRLIYKQSNINATTTVLKGLTATNEVLFLKITSEDNTTVTVKALVINY